MDSSENARSAARLLLDPVFGPYFVGKFLSVGGMWIHNVSAALLAYLLTGSALVVGLVSVVQFTPQLLTPWSGALADRHDRVNQLIAGRVVTVVGSGGFAIAIFALGAENPWTDPALLLSSGIVGVGFVVGGPAMAGIVPALVRKSELTTAVALYSVPMIAARATGPILGTVLLLQFDAPVAFAAAALSHVVFILVLARLKIDSRPKPSDKSSSSVFSGFRHVRHDSTLAVLLLGGACVGLGNDPAAHP